MKPHNEFIEDVKHASALPAQTCRALGPESQEDISMYSEESNHSPISSGEEPSANADRSDTDKLSPVDSLCEGGVQ